MEPVYADCQDSESEYNLHMPGNFKTGNYDLNEKNRGKCKDIN